MAAAAAAAAQSEELQAAIGRRAGPLNGAALACALAVQLRQSDTFDEGEFAEVWGEVNPSTPAAADPAHCNGATAPPTAPAVPAPATSMAVAPASA